jgi:hypothetical protein
MSRPTTSTLPDYKDLPVTDGVPRGSSWGLWGSEDVLGCLNLLTPQTLAEAASEVSEGAVFNLNLELELPDPPLFNRPAFEHVVHGFEIGHDDELRGWNTQRSSQWDGFRHMQHPAWGFYNGIADETHGIHHWARRGIAGRGVLVDVARWRVSVGRPLNPSSADEITIEDLTATLEAQRTVVRTGDVLLVRTGWLEWYRSLSAAGREAVVHESMSGTCGLRRGRETAEGLWNLHISAIAADNPALEVVPFGSWDRERMKTWREDPEGAADTMLHFSLLGLLGIPIGELFDLEALAGHCESDGRYSFLITSAPLNLEAGVATPPNALAIK